MRRLLSVTSVQKLGLTRAGGVISQAEEPHRAEALHRCMVTIACNMSGSWPRSMAVSAAWNA